MNTYRTHHNLISEFNMNQHNWQTKPLVQVDDLKEVICNILKEKFVVEIDGHLYDINFALNHETGEMEFGYSSAPSPHLKSYEIIDKTFREGKWFIVQN